jgi:DNA-binding CsgD family transcriptional regulator
VTAVTLPRPGEDQLTDEERELVDLLADGLSATEIGRRLFLAERTAQRRVQAVKAKTGARNATQLVAAVLIPRQPHADPDQAEALRPLVERIAARYGDTPEVTAARRAQLLADLRAHDTRPASNRGAWQRRTAAARAIGEADRSGR